MKLFSSSSVRKIGSLRHQFITTPLIIESQDDGATYELFIPFLSELILRYR